MTAHQIVLYGGSYGDPVGKRGTPPDYPNYRYLIEDLEAEVATNGAFMVIPHPMRQDPNPVFQPDKIDERYARLFEFHSHLSAEVEPLDDGPQLHELGGVGTNGMPVTHSLQYAWASTNALDGGPKQRLHIGVVGSSDNHLQMPGFNAYTTATRHFGSLAVVLAEENTRDALWDAMYARRTYGTTGPRIYAHLEACALCGVADGCADCPLSARHLLGEGFITDQPRHFTIRAAGAHKLAEVSLVKFDPQEGKYIEVSITTNRLVTTNGFTVSTNGFGGDGYTCEITIVDSNGLPQAPTSGLPVPEVLYYLRIRQQDLAAVDTNALIPGSVAVTTPIWVAAGECNTNGYPDAWEIAAGVSTDFNTNGIPDDCDIAAGTSNDCNTNGIPDEFDLMGWDTNRLVDLYDFGGFQWCFGATSNENGCLDSFDRALECGVVDLNDYAVFASQLGGPAAEWQMMMGGGGGGAPGESGSSGEPAGEGGPLPGEEPPPGEPSPEPAPPEEEPDPWTYEEAALAFEVRPVGGGDALTVLAPHTTYELHYQAGYNQVNEYALFAVAMSADQGLADAIPPATGDWSSAGDFHFYDIEADFGETLPAWGYPEGYLRTHVASDDFWPGTQTYAGPQGHLCTLTTGLPGVLHLELYMVWIDLDGLHLVDMWDQAQFLVEPPAWP